MNIAPGTGLSTELAQDEKEEVDDAIMELELADEDQLIPYVWPKLVKKSRGAADMTSLPGINSAPLSFISQLHGCWSYCRRASPTSTNRSMPCNHNWKTLMPKWRISRSLSARGLAPASIWKGDLLLLTSGHVKCTNSGYRYVPPALAFDATVSL